MRLWIRIIGITAGLLLFTTFGGLIVLRYLNGEGLFSQRFGTWFEAASIAIAALALIYVFYRIVKIKK
ncbi:hypothetical protein [Asticcacaulis sp.]|uniref:hypothetical protein n=1 Tax=Asticcacaulis sp. TaxID=1872648 RepID=UPI00262B1CE6|nr:hypothetical protein [Asticcacaulis sp.]